MAVFGYRRVTAELRATGCLVNHKKVLRLMREHGLTVHPRRRFVATTDSDHGGPIFPNLAKDVVPVGPNQLWVADITYIAIAVGFVYLAAILDAWSRRVVGYAIGRRVDARLALAALRAAIASRQPPKDCRTTPGARSTSLTWSRWPIGADCRGRNRHLHRSRERAEFNRIRSEQGLKAALASRDPKFQR